MQTILLWFFLINGLYMFRTFTCPSSGVLIYRLFHCRMLCYAIGVEAVVLRSWCVVLCTVCQLVSKIVCIKLVHLPYSQTLIQLLWSPSEPNSIEIGRRCTNTSILPYNPKGKVWLSVYRTARNSERPNSIIRRSYAKNVALVCTVKYTNCVYSQVHKLCVQSSTQTVRTVKYTNCVYSQVHKLCVQSSTQTVCTVKYT